MTNNITPAAHWQQLYDDGQEVTLPDGVTVRMRPTVSVGFLIASGRIPDSLTSVAMEGLPSDMKAENGMDRLVEGLKNLEDVYRIVCEEMWVSPRIAKKGDAPKKGEIVFEWLTQEQKDYTWTLVQLPLSEWKPFLQRQKASLEPVPNGTTEPKSAE